ncbi:exonuclease domain-containing protein [Roseovarius sp. SYSU LYC5161]|uniref:3'-5' exonuclease n=1 Tax=Roseovarius halophilus (ex Wu et al. 2025) TaxID=3376060 RepID=UPI00399AFA21
MGERLGLRQRFALFFAALATGGTAATTGALWLGHARYGGPVEGYVIAGLVAGFAQAGLATWVGVLFDRNVAQPIRALASDLDTRARAAVGADIDETPARYLGALAPAANAIHAALNDARAAQDRAIARETEKITREKALFETLMHDLSEGAIVLTPDHRIMLYNRVAQTLLGPIGLDRPISGFLRVAPLEHAINRIAAKRDRGEAESESFLAATADGARFLLGRVSPVRSEAGRIGHVVIFHDATDDLRSHAERDHLFNTLLEEVRRPAAAMSAVLDVLTMDADMPAKSRATFNAAMQQELDRLFTSLRENSRRYGAATARHWPASEVAAQDVFDALHARATVPLASSGGQHFLSCDGFAIIGLLTNLVAGLTDGDRRHEVTLAAEPHDHEVWITVSWHGDEVPDGLLDRWVRANVSDAYGTYSGRDVLDGHHTEIWAETLGAGHRIVLPLAAAGAPGLAPADARPEFYDFDLPQGDPDSDMLHTPLADLRFVVFDTETTGLAPRAGDRIVQIAGVRLINGRVLAGETFDTLVAPGRAIPAASTRVHGITDEMVADAPDIAGAGKQFHDYCEGSVLVAHNAPFDLAFLRLDESRIGRRFDHPALCTVLLSAAVFEHTGEHTLDALAQRLEVTIPPERRHTALGDAMATAEVFQRLIEIMHGRGIVTLADAIEAGNRMTRIRKAQDY